MYEVDIYMYILSTTAQLCSFLLIWETFGGGIQVQLIYVVLSEEGHSRVRVQLAQTWQMTSNKWDKDKDYYNIYDTILHLNQLPAAW